jgi:purine-binding chemotaxis protein CheW
MEFATQITTEGATRLTFQLSGEMYAVGILNVKEIIEYGQLTEIPMISSFAA